MTEFFWLNFSKLSAGSWNLQPWEGKSENMSMFLLKSRGVKLFFAHSDKNVAKKGFNFFFCPQQIPCSVLRSNLAHNFIYSGHAIFVFNWGLNHEDTLFDAMDDIIYGWPFPIWIKLFHISCNIWTADFSYDFFTYFWGKNRKVPRASLGKDGQNLVPWNCTNIQVTRAVYFYPCRRQPQGWRVNQT